MVCFGHMCAIIHWNDILFVDGNEISVVIELFNPA